MIIGFFGKGGSGKTTTCFTFLETVKHLYPNVLAIDADHNMDLSYNLGVQDIEPYVGKVKELPSGMRLMAGGPHTEQVFTGEICSHYLFRPLREYLRERPANPNELVVVDNTAGMDSVGAGIPILLDVAIVCVEPAIHSMKVGRQIVEALKRTQTPTIIAATKIRDEGQVGEIGAAFKELPMVVFPLK